MQLPKTLRWVEVDFPAAIDVKNEQLAEDRPNCRLERFAFDLTNRAATEAIRRCEQGREQALGDHRMCDSLPVLGRRG